MADTLQVLVRLGWLHELYFLSAAADGIRGMKENKVPLLAVELLVHRPVGRIVADLEGEAYWEQESNSFTHELELQWGAWVFTDVRPHPAPADPVPRPGVPRLREFWSRISSSTCLRFAF